MSQALQRASRSLRERWWLILVCMVLCTGIGFIYLFLAERIYAATAVVQYNADRDDVFELPDLSSEINLDRQLARFDRQRLNNYRDMLFSDALLQGVVAAGKLGEDPDFAPLAESAQRTRADLAEQLAQWVDVEIPASGGFLNITVRHPNPEMAAQLANSLAEELIRNDSASKEERIRSEIERLKMVMDAATKEVSQSGEGLAESQQDSVSRRAQRELDLQRLSDLSQRQIAATLRRIGIESECQRIAQAGTNVEELLKVPLVASDPNVAAIRASIILANVELERLLRRVKSGHPEYQRKVAELDALARQLEEAIGAAVEGARQNLEREQLQEKSLSEQYEKLSQEIRQNAQVNLADADQVLKQRLEVMVTLRGRILDGIKAATLRMSFLDSPLGIHQKAQPPTAPAEPQAARITTLGLVGGLILGLVLALALGLVDTSLRSLEETERFLSFPVLSALPRIESLEGPPSPVVVDPEAHFAAAEGFRSLRTSIAVLNKERPIQCILFTSAAPGEGKSFCALNLAASLAQQGHRTLLIESDLRRPKHRRGAGRCQPNQRRPLV